MNKPVLAGAVAALIAAVAGGLAFAKAEPAGQARPAQVRADADGDQRLSQAEFVGARVSRLTAADADRDGTVTPDERRAGHQARRAERVGARFDRLDADNDGSISRTEFDSAREARAERREGRPERGHRGHGRRGGGEHRMAARGPVVIAEAQAKAAETFARLDADRDGYLTVEERRAGREAMREQRRTRWQERRAARPAVQPSPAAPASE